MEESDLIDLLKRDDQSALKTIFNLYHTSLCQVAFRIVNDKDQAKDIVQDVFVKIWKNRHKLQINVSLRAYLKRAVVNTALNHLESTSKYKKQDLDKANLNAYSHNSIDHSILLDELTVKVNLALNHLPSRTLAVFTLIRTDEMTYKEVAATLNISLKAVEKEMMKALRLMREALKDYLNPSIMLILLNGLLI